jgi:hypothetical protein
MSESQIYDLECVFFALLAGGFLVAMVLRGLRRLQPDLNIGRAIAVAFGVRVFAALLVSATSFASQLRGGDEVTFLGNALSLSRWNLISSGTLDGLTSEFHTFVFSLNFRVFDRVPDMMLRIEAITFAVIGAALLAAAVYELAGRRAAYITAWVLALEPSNIFFSGIIHKEPFMLFAEGLVAFGGALLWKRSDFRALLPMVLGCLIATATRPYVGWFLAAGAAAVALHAGFRRKSPTATFALVTLVLALGVVFFPVVWNASSQKSLEGLQASQDANATNTSANLSLERVDYSTRGKIIVNLPKRVLDISTKPYPWQVGNASQQLGLLGTTAMFMGIIALIATLLQDGRGIMKRAGPLIYPALFLLVAYSLSAGNAGTAFRYRTHLVAFLLAVVCTLRETRASAVSVATPRERAPMQPVFRQRQPTT